MDGRRFDDLARSLASSAATRRRLLTGVVAAVVGAVTGGRLQPGAAQTACPPDQVRRAGIGCVCRATGRPPDPLVGCPCSGGRRRCTPTGACVECCGDGDCPGTPCINNVCGCPANQKLCRGVCIPVASCCVDADCDDGDPCTTNVCQPNRTCLSTPVADGGQGACPGGQVCCSGSCATVAGFCPPEQNFVDCQCLCDGNETKCGVECCADATETCVGGTASGSCCADALVCVGGTACCGAGQACCSDACIDIAGFCPPEQDFSNCACVCDAGETKCGVECCVNATETCLGGTATGSCCPTGDVCGAACCGAGEACCSGSCVVTATFCPPEQTFDDCVCVCDGNETICGPECCVDATETCIDAATDFCCPTQRACQGDTLCCDPGEACCLDVCETIATFCPPAQTFQDCACVCDAGETACGDLCCTSATETCLNDASCCPDADACVVDAAPDECCTGNQVCGGGIEGCCLPTDTGTCAADGDCCGDLWCEAATDLCRVPRTNGAACDRAAQCDSGFCCPTENVCGVPADDTCALDADCCGDLWCRAADDICVPALAVGAVCERDAQCEVGNCCVDDDVCGVADGVTCDPLADECCPGLACRGTAGSETCQPNLPPVANAQTGANAVETGDEDPITITLTGSDPNNDPLTFAIVTPLPAGAGTLGPIVPVDATSATVEYTPPATSAAGQTFSFTFTVNDGAVDSPPATVEIEVFEEAPDVAYTTVGNTELVVDSFGTIPATPHVTVADGVLAGTTTLTVDEPSPITTTEGGTVTIESDGDFRYTPPIGFTGTDTFDYTVNWGGAGTVTITVGSVVWYVNNAGTNGDGRSQSPFNTLAGAQTASDPGEIVFVHRGNSGTTPYGGGIVLKDDQSLIGEGVALVVDTFTLVTAGLPPQLTNGSGAAITLASDNTVRGLDVVGTGGAGIVGTGLGAATFTANNVNVTRTGGPALDLENGNVNATFGTLSSTNSPARGLRLVGLTGTLSATSGSISGADLGAVFVSGGNAAITYPGAITNDTGPAVEVNNRTGGTVTLSGAITDTGTTNAGISLGGNPGNAGTIAFTGAVSITDTAAAALRINNGTAAINFSNLTITQTNGQPGLASADVQGGSLTVQGSGGINVSGTGAGNDAIILDGLNNAWDVTLAKVTVNTNNMRHGLFVRDLGAGSDVTITSGTITSEGSGRRTVVFTVGTDGTYDLSGVTLNGNNSDGLVFGPTALGTYQLGDFDVNAPNGGVGVWVSDNAVNVTLKSVDQAGGTRAIQVGNLGSGGSVTVNGGAISGTTVAAVDVDGGGGTISIASTITNTAGRTAMVQNRTGGTVTFSGNLTGGGTGILVKDNATSGTPAIVFSGTTKAINTGTNAAVTLDNNDVATVTFSGGGLDVDTTTGVGLLASGGGTLLISGSNNSVTATAGQAIDLDAITTNVALASVASTGSAVGVAGIDLTNLANTSTFTVSGTTAVTNPGGTGINVATVGTGATLGFGTTTVTNRSGKGVALSAVSGAVTFGATTITNPSNNDLAAFEVVNSAASVTVTSATISNVAGANGRGLNLDNNTGVITIQAGAITAVTAGIGVRVNAGNANVTYAGTVTNTGGRTVAVTNRTGGTVTLSGDLTGGGTGILVQDNNASGTPAIVFSGATKTLSTAANPAVTLDNNDVATITFSGGGLAITTTTGIGFDAKNGAAAITVTTGANPNTITSGTGTALSVVSSNIGASGLTFRSISASGGTNGIILNATGTTAGTNGGLTVTGTGTTDGTGGTIQNTTGRGASFITARDISLKNMNFTSAGTSDLDATNGGLSTGDNLDTNAAIHLVTVTNATFDNVNISGGAEQGINGNNVTNFQLLNSTILNAGNGPDEDGLHFFNMLGTCAITNTSITSSGDDNVNIQNGSGTSNITFTGGSFNTGVLGSGLLFGIRGTNNATITISGVTCADNFSGGIVADAFENTTMNLTVNNNTTSSGNNDQLSVSAGDNSLVNLNVTGSVFSSPNVADFVVISLLGSALDNGYTFDALISGNTITVGNGLAADGILVNNAGGGDLNVAITGNTFDYAGTQRAILLQSGQDGSGNLQATVTGNNIDIELDGAGNAVTGILVQASVTSPQGDGASICADIGGAGALRNTFTHSLGGNMAGGDIRVRQRLNGTVRLPGYGGGATDTAAVVTYLAGRNTLVNSPTATATADSTGFAGGAACTAPS